MYKHCSYFGQLPSEAAYLELHARSSFVFTARRYASAVYVVVVCLCVCLSVTLPYCIKTDNHRMMQECRTMALGL